MEGLERQLLDAVDGAYTVDLLQRLVRIPSVFPPKDPGPIRAAADLVREELEAVDVPVQVVGDEGEGWARPNVVGRLKGDGSAPALILAAHTDVVPEYDVSAWQYPPFEGRVVDGVIHGRGTADTKGSVAAMVSAVRAVVRAGLKLRGDVVLAAWAGDEWPWLPGAQYFNGLSYLALTGVIKGERAILGEPYDLRVTYCSRGRIWFRFEVGGESTHSATGHGINAIRKAIRLMDAVYSIPVGTHPVLGRDTINIGVIEGGDQPNMVPDWCRMAFDIRFGPPLTVDSVREMVEEKIGELRASDPEFILKSMEIPETKEPIEFPPDSLLNRALQQAGRVLGRDFPLGGALSFGDIALWKDQVGIKEACLFGPGETKQAHAVNEHIRVEDLITAARAYALAIYYLCC